MSKISSKIKIIFKALTANLADFGSLLSNLRLATLAKSDDKNAKARTHGLICRQGAGRYFAVRKVATTKKSHNDKRNSRANLSLKNVGIL